MRNARCFEPVGRCARRQRVCASLRPAEPTRLRAQQDAVAATLAGAVLDQAGKALQKAGVVVRNESASIVRTATTDTEGRFSVSGLPAGVYAEATLHFVERTLGMRF